MDLVELIVTELGMGEDGGTLGLNRPRRNGMDVLVPQFLSTTVYRKS